MGFNSGLKGLICNETALLPSRRSNGKKEKIIIELDD
jgi:hypothetical protein